MAKWCRLFFLKKNGANPPLRARPFLDISATSRAFRFCSQRCEVSQSFVAPFTKDMSASRQVECFSGCEVNTDGASVGLVQSVRHLPECLCDVRGHHLWALKSPLNTNKHSVKCGSISNPSSVKFIDLRPRKRLLLTHTLHFCFGISSLLSVRHFFAIYDFVGFNNFNFPFADNSLLINLEIEKRFQFFLFSLQNEMTFCQNPEKTDLGNNQIDFFQILIFIFNFDFYIY